MSGHVVIIAVVMCLLLVLPVGAADSASPLKWEQLPPLPDHPGLAGAFAGISRDGKTDYLLVAGGCNFPDKAPWDGGIKTFHDTVYALDLPAGQWKAAGKLDRPTAYGVSITTPHGVLCVGGSSEAENFADAFLLNYRNGQLTQSPLPPLPMAVSGACGATMGSTVYIAGGMASPDALADESLATVWSIDLDARSPQWTKQPPLPVGRFHAVAGVQDGSFFVFSGIRRDAGKLVYLTDAYRLTPGSGWKRLADLPHPNAAAPSPAPSLGQSHLLLLGGGAQGAHAGLPMKDRPGFDVGNLLYHTITDTWTPWHESPAPRVVTPAVPWAGKWIVPSGESRPGVRSPEVWICHTEPAKSSFGGWNYLTLASYPLVMLAISWFVGRKRSSEEYFRGGQRIPWWAAGISIFATMLSSITYMAIPARAYWSDWTFFLAGLATVIVAPIVVGLYLPFFRRLNVTSAYEYLEKRFNLPVRWFGSISFVFLQVGRTAIVLYLPSLALATVSNLPLAWCIILMGAISILMTFLGGIESVVWTDVAQTVILTLGAVITFALILFNTEGSLAGYIDIATRDQKLLQNLQWGLNPAIGTVWVIVIGQTLANLIAYTASQDVVQRYFTTPTQKQASRAIWTNAWVSIPAGLLFFALGTALYVFYKQHPGHLDPTIKNDAIYPLFMVRELPAGVAGLVVAGIFAAAQPTSNLNSIATSIVTDFVQRLKPSISDKTTLKYAQWITVLFGIIGTGVALTIAMFPIMSIYDVSMGLAGLTGGALAGLFALGIFTRRANGAGAIIGAIAGIIGLYFIQQRGTVHFMMYGGAGIAICFVIGYLASFLFPGSKKSVEGLTIFGKSSAPAERVEPAMANA